MIPVPGFKITTAYGKRGRHWSCRRNSAGEGIHTGVDYAAPKGTWIVAPISGQIRHRSYGSAFGPYGFAISPDPGQPFAKGEVFFAHTLDRPKDGLRVKAGDRIARVGALGNATGPHLHMEFMPSTKGKWNCSVHANPKPVIDWEEPNVSNYDYKYLGKPKGTLTVGTKYVKLDQSTWTPPRKGWESTLVYLNVTPTFKTGKSTGALRIRIVRSDGDKTAYCDFPISKDTLEGGSTLITYTYWELGEAGAKGKTHVELRCHGGLASVKIGTRYTKKCVVVK